VVFRWLSLLLDAAALSVFLSVHAIAQSALSLDQRTEALLAKMSLEEKIGQMTQVDMNALKQNADIKNYFLGSMLSGGDSDPADISAAGWAKAVEEYQSWAFRTRLKIPLLYGIDAVHGHNNVDGAVIFPHHIGMGATRDPALVERAGRAVAAEVAATGIRWTFSPCIAVPQNPRWGRTYEGFGSTPELAELMGTAEICGLQGKSLQDPSSVLACAKHFLADGGTRDGIDQGDAQCDEASLRKLHLAGYAAAVKAGVGSVMVSYSSWNGRKMHANGHLITDVLKGELGFQGFVVSDWAAIDQISPDYRTDIETSINAGLDMVMIPNGPGRKNNYVEFISLLKELVEHGKISRGRIDDAVRRILRMKFRLGLFEEPFADRRLVASVGSAEHREVARECVRESLVLLKNANQRLPLAKKIRRLHVIGKAATDLSIQCGGWTLDWQGRAGSSIKGGTTILTAIKRSVAPEAEVTYSASAAAVRGADVAVVVIGEPPYAEGQGDRSDLHLVAADVALIEAVKATGVPIVTILLSGRPLILGRALEASDAFLAAWLPGTESQGIADVLFADYKPTGKLPCSWLASMDDLASSPGTIAGTKPLFEYGYGLTYGGSEGKMEQRPETENR
jgi:beta-glucosidase